jgi:hypothetical protein
MALTQPAWLFGEEITLSDLVREVEEDRDNVLLSCI